MKNENGNGDHTKSAKPKTKPTTSVATGKKKPKGYRNPEGLTAKQAESIPIIAAAKTVYRGVMQCVDLGIICTTSYFYRQWNKEPAYHKKLWETRMAVQGEITRAVVERFRHHAEDNVDIIQNLAYKALDERVRLMAAKAALSGAGVETGGGAKINVSTTSVAISEKQDGFRETLAEQLQKRLRVLSSEDEG